MNFKIGNTVENFTNLEEGLQHAERIYGKDMFKSVREAKSEEHALDVLRNIRDDGGMYRMALCEALMCLVQMHFHA